MHRDMRFSDIIFKYIPMQGRKYFCSNGCHTASCIFMAQVNH